MFGRYYPHLGPFPFQKLQNLTTAHLQLRQSIVQKPVKVKRRVKTRYTRQVSWIGQLLKKSERVVISGKIQGSRHWIVNDFSMAPNSTLFASIILLVAMLWRPYRQ